MQDILIISVLRRLRQDDHFKYKDKLDHIVSVRPTIKLPGASLFLACSRIRPAEANMVMVKI